jgi:hypothetical protein
MGIAGTAARRSEFYRREIRKAVAGKNRPAILISGAISIVALNGQRNVMSEALFGFFRRMNARIDASTRAEDVD